MGEPPVNKGDSVKQVTMTTSQVDRAKTLRQLRAQHERLEESTWNAYRASSTTREQEDASDRRNFMLATSAMYRENARNYLKSIGKEGDLDTPIPQSVYLGKEQVVMNGPYVEYIERDNGNIGIARSSRKKNR